MSWCVALTSEASGSCAPRVVICSRSYVRYITLSGSVKNIKGDFGCGEIMKSKYFYGQIFGLNNEIIFHYLTALVLPNR
jgi:hypothetical protein